MNKFLAMLVWLVILQIIAVACTTKRILVPVETVRTVTEVVRDTVVNIVLPPQKVTVEVADTVAVAENDYSIAIARFSQVLGTMHLNLINKDVEIPVKVVYKDKEVYVDKLVPYEVEVIKYRDRPTPWYDILARWLSLGMAVITILIIKFK